MPEDSLLRLKRELREFAMERDWVSYHNPKNLAMALAGETGELVALLQWMTPEEAAGASAPDHPLRPSLEDELADVLIYLVRLADALDIDVRLAADEKMARNRDRFPKPTSLGAPDTDA